MFAVVVVVALVERRRWRQLEGVGGRRAGIQRHPAAAQTLAAFRRRRRRPVEVARRRILGAHRAPQRRRPVLINQELIIKNHESTPRQRRPVRQMALIGRSPKCDPTIRRTRVNYFNCYLNITEDNTTLIYVNRWLRFVTVALKTA